MTSNKNKKIPYPPEIPDYISTRLLKEQLLDYLRANGKPEKVNDSLVRSTIMRFKIHIEKIDLPNAILRKGDRGKEQFKKDDFLRWLQEKHTSLNNFKTR